MPTLFSGEIATWLTIFSENVAVGMVLVLIYNLTQDWFPRLRAKYEPILIGLLFGCGALISGYFPMQVPGGYTADGRTIFVLVGSLFGGPIGCAIVAVMSIAGRIAVSGDLAPPGAVGNAITAVIGFLLWRRLGHRIHALRGYQLFGIGVVNLVVVLPVVEAVLAIRGAPLFPLRFIAMVSVIGPLGTVLLGSAMGMTHYRILRQTQRRLDDFIETASDLVWETDEAERFVQVSGRFSEVTGYAPAELLGRTGYSLGGRWLDAATEGFHTDALAAHKRFAELKYVVPRKGGGKRILSITGRPVFDGHGKFVGYRGTAADVTERMQSRELMNSIGGRVADIVGTDFLRMLTQIAAETLGVDSVFIGRFDHNRDVTLQLYNFRDGEFRKNLKPVPNEGLPNAAVARGEMVKIMDGVAAKYPKYAEVVGFPARAYAAMPLRDAAGTVVGMLSFESRTSWHSSEYLEAALSLFAGRAAAEIERMVAEEEIRLSHQRLEQAQQIGEIGSADTNLVDGTATWSDELCRLFGIPVESAPRTRDEAIRTIISRFTDEDKERAHAILRQMQADGPMEMRILSDTGGLRWFQRQAKTYFKDGQPVRRIITYQDITARKHMEEALRRSHDRMAEVLTALDAARSSVVITDPENRVVYANAFAIDLRGLSPGEQLTGKRLRDFQIGHPEYVALADEATRAVETQGHWQGLIPWRRSIDNQLVYLDTRIQRLPNGGSVVVANDATERIRLEEEKLKQREREMQSAKIEALGNLAGGIAHDFNNLLGAILGFADFLVQDLQDRPQQQAFATRIAGVGQRGRSLVQQILAFSRRTKLQEVITPLRDSIVETHGMLRPMLPSTSQIVVRNDVPDALLVADKGQLVQVLVNLCVNASDSLGSAPGTVTISVTRPDRMRPDLARLPPAEHRPSPAAIDFWFDEDGTGHLVTGGLPPRDCVSLAVTDTGSGIPRTVLRSILEPFVTTKEEGKGTGLGLAVVHRIVLEYGGAMVVTSREGAGTRFEIILPLSVIDEDSVEDSPHESEAPEHPGGTSFLVVDDDEAYLSMVETALQRMGYRVRAVGGARIALETLRHEAFDVLVCDQTMPHLRGTDLIKTCKAARPRTVCIVCTGSSGGLNEEQAIAAGADGLMLKPYNVRDLAALASRLLSSKSGAGSAPSDPTPSPPAARSAVHKRAARRRAAIGTKSGALGR